MAQVPLVWRGQRVLVVAPVGSLRAAAEELARLRATDKTTLLAVDLRGGVAGVTDEVAGLLITLAATRRAGWTVLVVTAPADIAVALRLLQIAAIDTTDRPHRSCAMAGGFTVRCAVCGAAAVVPQRDTAEAFAALHQRPDRCGRKAAAEATRPRTWRLTPPRPCRQERACPGPDVTRSLGRRLTSSLRAPMSPV